MIKNKKTSLLAMVMLAGLTTACGKQEVTEEQMPEVSDEITVIEEEVLEEEVTEDNSNVNMVIDNEEIASNEEELVLADEMIEVSDLELLKELMDKKETFYAVISAKTCGDCKMYLEETLNHYSKEEVGVHLVKIEWTDLSEDQKTEVRELTKLGIEWTPTTFLFKNGESVEKYEGNLTINQLKEIVNK